jgi:hypothetical protein
MAVNFKENQTFTQWWLWLILLVILMIPSYGLYQQVYLGEPMGNNPMSNTELIAYFGGTLVFVIGFITMRLITHITDKQIRIRFFPFVRKSVEWEDVKQAKVVDYGFVGGWGIRFGTEYGTVYNIKGKKGLAIELNSGKKFLIGTQKAEQLEKMLDARQHSI